MKVKSLFLSVICFGLIQNMYAQCNATLKYLQYSDVGSSNGEHNFIHGGLDFSLDGNLLVSSQWTKKNSSDLVLDANIGLVKVDQAGAVLWQKIYKADNRTQNVGGQALQRWEVLDQVMLLDSSIILLNKYYDDFAFFSNPGKYSLGLLRVDKDGAILWHKYIDGDLTEPFNITSDGGSLYVSAQADTNNVYFAKLDTAGNIDWQRFTGDVSKIDEIVDITITSDEGMVLIAKTKTYSNSNEAKPFMLKMGMAGDRKWVKNLQVTVGDREINAIEPIQVIQAKDNGHILLANVKVVNHAKIYESGIGNTLLVIKYDVSGNVEWTSSLGGSNPTLQDIGASASIIADYKSVIYTNTMGGYDIMTVGISSDNSVKPLFCRLDSTGNHLWSRIIEVSVDNNFFESRNSFISNECGIYAIGDTALLKTDPIFSAISGKFESAEVELFNFRGWQIKDSSLTSINLASPSYTIKSGVALKVENTSLSMSVDSMFYNNFITSDTLVCAEDTVTFYSNLSDFALVDSVEWDFAGGTPVISTGIIGKVLYPNPGVYDVKMIIHHDDSYYSPIDSTDTIVINKYIHVQSPSLSSITGDTLICQSTGTNLSSSVIGSGNLFWTYTTDFQEGSVLGSTIEISINPLDTVELIAISRIGAACVLTENQEVYPDVIRGTPPSDTNLCFTGTNDITLVANGASNYRWSTGSTDSFIVLNDLKSGTNEIDLIIASDVCEEDSVMYQIHVNVNTPDTITISSLSAIELNTPTVLSVNVLSDDSISSNNVVWSTGDTGLTISITPTQDSLFSVSYLNNNSCGDATDTLHIDVDEEETSSIESSYFNSIIVSPNPTSDIIQVGYELIDADNVIIKVYNQQGQLLQMIQQYLDQGLQRHVINMREYPNGIYVIKLQAGKGAFVQKKIMKH